MSEENPFLEALRKSVEQLNATFEEADRALQDAVAEASAAVREFTAGKMELRLDPVDEGKSGRRYDLDVKVLARPGFHTVDQFFVPQTGFPIWFGSNVAGEKFEKAGELSSREAIREYLVGQIGNPDSPLAVTIAYNLRRKE